MCSVGLNQVLQLYELFGKCGEVKRIVMGLDKFKRTPCGFCFVEYYAREDAEQSMRYINGTRLDDRIIRTDFDAGFIEGRQYGRGKSGGQVGAGLAAACRSVSWSVSRLNFGHAIAWLSNDAVNLLPGQVRDEYRTDFDSGRGGYGKIVQQKLEVPSEFV